MNEYIERLAEINAANDIIAIGDDLRNERKNLVNILIENSIIELGNNGDFHFYNLEDKETYLTSYRSF